ncbi:MAG: hypothetical protein A2021_08180 [Elusimicrobia bacterium GWF2_52_66]|nr:MAG: hypothetical protein A2021_08180 [Elusimicrobia bacterium GWF2_52_66]
MSRAFLSLLIFVLIVYRTLWSELAALALLTAASISDYYDGEIARRTRTITPFGAIADPFADKILVMGVFLAFASLRELTVPLWAVFLILLRELTISTLRVIAALRGEVMKAEIAGKFKTTVQLTSAFIILVVLIIKVWAETHILPAAFLSLTVSHAGQTAYWLTVFTALVTVISGAVYLYKHRDLLIKSWNDKGPGGEGARE